VLNNLNFFHRPRRHNPQVLQRTSYTYGPFIRTLNFTNKFLALLPGVTAWH